MHLHHSKEHKKKRLVSPFLSGVVLSASLLLSGCSGVAATDKLQADTTMLGTLASGTLHANVEQTNTGTASSDAATAPDTSNKASQTAEDSSDTSSQNHASPANDSAQTTPLASSDGFSTAPPLDASADYGDFSGSDIPAYTGDSFAAVNDNMPFFTDDELKKAAASFEDYSELDELGRCGAASASVSEDTMPDKARGNIGQVKPSGWQSVKYDIVDGKYLYNRSHLIGYQLTAEDANPENLITGTRAFNVDGMLPFENMVADYVHETGNHVLYRVTPVFTDDNLIADGVLMEAESVEDDGEALSYNVFVYNVQPGIAIDYETGDSILASELGAKQSKSSETQHYTLNTNSKKFHYPDCSAAKKISDKNREDYEGTREDLVSEGYEACGICKP